MHDVEGAVEVLKAEINIVDFGAAVNGDGAVRRIPR